MTENYFYLKRIRLLKTVLKTFFLCLALLLAIQSGKAEDLYNVGSLNNVTISQGGYMEVDVPVYDCDYSDEAVHEGVFYLSVGGNNYDLFYWSSQDAYDKWQNDSGHHSHWAKFKRNGNNTAAVLVSGNSIETYYKGGINTGQHTDGSVTHRVTVYLSENLLETYMGKQVTIYTTVDIDENGDDSNGGINGGKSADKTMPNWSNPTVMTPNFSNEVGKYDVVWTVTNAPANSQYRWNGIGDWQTSTSGTTNKFDVSNTQQTCNLQFQYRISDYQRITTSASVILPAYQQPLNFTASDFTPDNGDTKLSWNVAPSQTSQQTGDAFEIQRSADPGFATAITVGTINYDPSKTSYELTDKTSDENLNGKVYYRIRRTKASAWQWSFCKTTDIEKKMSHKGIRDESVLVGIDDNNKALVTWDFDEGNVASDNSQIIVERVNLITQQKDKIALPYAATTMSYEEELTAMCQEFMYNIYIVPGNSKYSTQEPVPSQLKDSERRIIPLNLGTVPVIRASKGYFSDRVELEWELSDGAIETFAITRRLCGSMDEFKQIDTQASYEASKAYTYSDVTGIPGQLYEYRITGLTNCADGVHETYSSVTIGFRTPTGDIYGRVTFENGQAVENVEINVETEENIRSKSLAFTSGSFASISNKDLLKNNLDAITLQAWIAPDATTGLQKVISKDGMYELGIDNNRFYFKAGTETLKTDTLSVTDVKDGGDFMHLTGVYDGNRLLIYINGQLIARTTTSVAMTGNDNPVQFGGGVFEGIIDEVRIWSSDLTAEEIKRDYNRYLTGGEKSLLAYYTFNYAVNTEFYDISFEGTEYNENHGTFEAGVTLSDNVPPVDQLGYRGVTAADGSYSVRSIPYQGNGTAYRIIPRMGIHTFESEQEVRFIGQGAQSHTVNFTDKSSFKVTGWVTYENSTIPVQGVGFNVDGKAVLKSNGIPEETDATGRFEIRVPVGTHEVKATKANHTFVNDGRITDQYGLDLNYQDEVLGVELEDNTTIKYIGRVAGGAEQEAFPIGHSLSTNNLAEGITVTLTYSNQAYTFDSRTLTEEHFKPSNKNKAHVNEVVYAPDQNHKNDIVIHVNDTTGEFVAHVIPERFNVTVNAGHHTSIPGSGSEINLSQQSIIREEVYEYTDSIMDDGNWIRSHYSDIVTYQFSQKFIKRYSPEIRITQLDKKNVPLPYFGLDTVRIANMIGQTDTIPLYNGTSYTFGRPVFQQHEDYTLQMEIFEKYAHYKADGNESGKIDEVPTSDATFKFNNEIANSDSKEVEVEANEKGLATHTFKAGDPELTSAERRMEVTVTYGSIDNPVSINWAPPASFANGNAYVLGYLLTGYDFVTAGPDKVLTVLRDPPGSNSYSYLEKGITFTESSAYTGSVKNTGSEDFTTGVKTETVVFAGIGAGKIETVMETDNGVTLGISHEEQYEGQDTKTTTTTTTTRFQTSDDPLYVGANGDVYVGYSTNVSFGTTNSVTIVPRSKYEAAGGTYDDPFYNSNPDWVLLKSSGMSASQSFNTLFAYPQIHIEEVLIPKLESIRNNLLLQPDEYSIDALQAQANATGETFYVSYFKSDSIHFGKSNDDSSLSNLNNANGDPQDLFDGPSYRIIYKENTSSSLSDTIVYLNQSIAAWKARMLDNEKAKKEAELLENYSFHGGSPVEYSESYSGALSHESSFYIMIGGKVANDSYIGTVGPKIKFEFSEEVQTQHGGTWTSEVEASHTKGFVLAEDGTDYISVDVCREKGWTKESEEYKGDDDGLAGEGMLNENDLAKKDYYSSFVFKTKAGVTCCPYEGAYVTKYFEPGQHTLSEATMRVEVPEIDMPVKFIENVPSGETAKLQLYLRNNSESQDDAWYDLKVLDASNPNGARFSIDGTGIGNGRAFLVPAGETLIKTLEVGKGAVLNYDDLQLILQSQCQYDPTDFLEDIADTVTFTVHFIPSCTNVNIKKPGNNWTYNTRLPQTTINGIDKHYMEVLIDGFDVNYDNFGRIELQYKSASQSDDEWTTLMNYYNDSTAYEAALENGLNAEMILASYAGTIPYRFVMDDLPDQRYDLRAVSVCIINNEEVRNESEIRSGIKDMYLPRLFGSPQPADGILNVEDDVRLNFNEPIAEGLLTRNNFTVQGVRNGSITDHSTSIELDGINDYLETEFEKNLEGKDVTVEMWIQAAQPQNATLFSHGNINESLELAITSDNKLQVTVGSTTLTSPSPVAYDQGSWAHVALVYEASGYLTAYYNYTPAINRIQAATYNGIGNVLIGKSIKTGGNPYGGKIHNVRIWEKTVTSADLQVNSLAQLSGIETGLIACYPMNEGKGTLANDIARGVTLLMNGCQWALPDGFAVATDGKDYLKIDAGTAAITKAMDFTVEFWFKAEPEQTASTLFSNGRGDGNDLGGSEYLFNIGFDENGVLAFTNNGVKTTVEGNYLDNNWHHFAIGVDRAIGRGQIYMDGKLNTYIDAVSIGGISSAYFYLGARGWYHPDNASELIVDNHFKGQFDDLRFWQLYKNERLVSENNNVKLSGKELGLLHYYPFDTYIEWQGIEYLEFTNKDMRIASGVNPETDQFAVVGASEADIQSKDIAPLKDAGPVADLEFDFVVNNDALIINLKEQEYKVAKTIVTFTVDDVRDKNGNSIASPVTWSAYIDRNQLKWSEDRLNLTKEAYAGLEFTVRAVNSGGAIQRYTINNIPAWLDVTPSEGTVNPSSYEEIHFSVNEGLNIGSYNEVIYLTNEDKVSEALTLNLTVTGEKPDWTVNPADFKYNMSVFGKMRFNNIFSTDKEDMLAAFDNGVCVGVTTSVYNKTLDMWYALLTVYNNNLQSSNLEFRMWDASTGKIYKAIPDTEIQFVNDAVIGDADEPVIFDGKEIFYQNIVLQKGWNWISFNLANNDLTDVNKTLVNGKWTAQDVVKGKEYFDSYSPSNKKWTGTLSSHNGFNNTSMFMLLSSQAQTISTSGTVIDTKTTPIAVNGKQWNYIGYLPSVNTTVKEGLAGYDAQKGDVVKSQNRFAMFTKNEWIGDLTYLEASKGYMLYRTAADNVTFTYPSVSGALSNLRSAVIVDEQDDKFINTAFAENMNVIATASGLQEGDRILAYINRELRGTGEIASNAEQALSFITIAGNEANANVRFEWQRNGEILGTTSAPFSYLSNTVTGTPENPVRLDFGIRDSKVSVYPNPFQQEFKINLDAEKDSPIEVKVLDISGRIVWVQTENALFDGTNTIVVNGASFEAGVYIVKITVDGVIVAHIVEKVTN